MTETGVDGFTATFGSRRGSNRSDDENPRIDPTAEYQGIAQIHNGEQLRALFNELGLRPDWHEPDNQGISATVHGGSFDNAMAAGWGLIRTSEFVDDDSHYEMNVVLRKDGQPIAVVNLATLFALATNYDINKDEKFSGEGGRRLRE